MKLGSINITNPMRGSTPINKVMRGIVLIWERVVAEPVAALFAQYASFFASTSGNLSRSSGFDFPAATPIMLSFWIKVTTAQVAQATTFDSGASVLRIHAPFSDKMLYWDFGGKRLSFNFTNYLDKWTHVMLTDAGVAGGRREIFLDKVSVASANDATGTVGIINTLVIGSTTSGSTPWKGMMEDVRIYKAVKTIAQVNPDAPLTDPAADATLHAYYRFDGNANDSGPNAKHLTVTGGVQFITA